MQGENDRSETANIGGTVNGSAAERPGTDIDEEHPGDASKEEPHPSSANASAGDGRLTDSPAGVEAAEDARAGDAVAGDARAGDAATGNAVAEESHSEESQSEGVAAEESRADESGGAGESAAEPEPGGMDEPASEPDPAAEPEPVAGPEPEDGQLRVYLPPPISGPPLVPGVPAVDPAPIAPAAVADLGLRAGSDGGTPAPTADDPTTASSASDTPAGHGGAPAGNGDVPATPSESAAGGEPATPVGGEPAAPAGGEPAAPAGGVALAAGEASAPVAAVWGESGPAVFVPQAGPPVGALPVQRRRRTWLVGVPTVFAAVLVAIGVFFAATTVFDAIDRTGAAPAAARSSAPPVVTPEAYQQMLAAADAAIAVPFQQFAAATGPAALDSTATALATAIDAEADTLSAVRPPEAATAAHQLLVGGLSRLQWEPAGVDIEGRVDGASCTGSAGAASVARTTPAGQVREAAAQLKAVDARYVFGSFLPAATELQSRRMDNGTYLKRTSTNGSGQLKVNNDGPKDTAVSLVLAGETAPRLTVYVHAKSSFTAKGITDGNYLVYTTAGIDWDPGMKVFSRDCEFTKFKDGLEFKTNSGTYTVWTISLSPSESGNAPVEDVDADTYPTG